MLAVSNTSPISNLACIGRLDLLRAQFGEIWIPRAVEAELAAVPDGAVRTTIDQTRQLGWLKGRAASDANLVSLLTVELHRGDAEAIALALEMNADWLLMDEREGRAMARQLGLHVTGVPSRQEDGTPRSHQARTRRPARQGPFLSRQSSNGPFFRRPLRRRDDIRSGIPSAALSSREESEVLTKLRA
jgi:predicted nucleic acid-binding protein